MLRRFLSRLRGAPAPRFEPVDESRLTATDSGLLFEVLREGEGRRPSGSDRVRVHYAGWLTDGTAFDSSYSRGKPARFPLDRVIAGWTEGLQLMREGAAYRFVIPPALAYGARGAPPRIGPQATLVFHVELVAIDG